MNFWHASLGDGAGTEAVRHGLAAVCFLGLATSTSQLAILRKYGLSLKKGLGQHILIDDNIARKIVAGLDLKADDGVVEIGSGLGALTFRLAPLVRRLVAVEIDGRFASALNAELVDAPNVEVARDNILKVDLGKLTRPYKDVADWKVVGNLPYYITSAIVMQLVEAKQYFSRAIVTVQDEFARRLVARPGSKDYSSLSIYAQYHFRPELLFTIRPTSFFPRPDVRSAVVCLEVLDRPRIEIRDEGLFFQTIKAAFGQRRKTLRRSLRQIPGLTPDHMDELSRTSGVGLDDRPEHISIEQFASLANAMKRVVG